MTRDPLNLAMEYEQSGRLAEAEKICKSILERQPNMSAAWHVWSIVAARAGRPDVAVQRIERGIAIDPTNAAMHANLGEFHRRLGRLDAAIASLRRAIELQPGLTEAWNNLGNAMKDKGMLDDALAAYNKAVALQPNFAMAHNNIGIALRLKGDLDQSIAAFDRAIELAPTFADAHGNRGNALRDKGRLDDAIAEYQRAIRLQPDSAAPHANLGNALADRRQYDAAIAAYRRALQLKADYPEALANLASALRETKRFEEASAAARAAIQLKPDYAEAYDNLGSILFDQERCDEAVDSFRKALELKPSSAVSYNNLALALGEIGQMDEAIRACRTAVRLQGDYAGGWNSLGNLLARQGEYEEAAAAFRRAIQLEPDYALAHWNLSFIPLLFGDFETGWTEHEWRKRTNVESRPREFAQPEWDGGELNGRTILIHAEQGFGDTIQFVRYVPAVAARGGRVVLRCPAELAALMRHSLAIAEVVSGDDLPNFSCHCPLLSLPAVFKTRLETVATDVPYLKSPPESAARWRGLLEGGAGATRAGAIRVGLVWAGNPRRKLDRQRSLRLEQLLPLATVPGIQFYSLQKGQAAQQAPNPPGNMELIDLTAKLSDFAETAGLIENLNLVISVDTAVAHLAGAMGKPVWVLLGRVPAWRWMLDRTDSPWYPTMRLFRQPVMDDWNTPIAQLAKALRELVGD
ncbi:MAG: tetratricopeptide repeat protein [Tepidisphaeraceae bacterium]